MSKVINLKAIHNILNIRFPFRVVVSNVSKVINLKAIHNDKLDEGVEVLVVSNVSKVINLKAIHNSYQGIKDYIRLFPMCQR